ncbi:MAG: tail fiber domain-containing protein [Salibacteraceae bacterium]
MRKLMLTAALAAGVGLMAQAQITTFGTNAGTLGNLGSYYGYFAGNSTTSSGIGNSFYGAYTGQNNTTGDYNSGYGYRTMYRITTGIRNTAVGPWAMYNNETGSRNAAVGALSLHGNTSGRSNSALGNNALAANQTGSDNVAVGAESGPGSGALSNTTCLGHDATATASDQVRLGNISVTSIGGYANWSNISDGRFKQNVTENVMGLDFINQLRPVSYTLDAAALNAFLGIEADAEDRPVPTYYQTGFIAQEVEATAKDLGFTTFNGVDKPANEASHYGIRYSEFVVPLVKAVQELSAQVEAQQQLLDRVTELEAKIAELETENRLGANSGATGASLEAAETTALYQNSPNPFHSSTEIRLQLPMTVAQAEIVIYTLDGKPVKTIPVTERGQVALVLEASSLSAGMYHYALLADQELIATKRMVLTH